jgi:hypothetical protein
MMRAALTGLVFILIAAAGLPSAADPAAAASPELEAVSAAATCAAEPAGSLELPALPPELGGQQPIFAACNQACLANCTAIYNNCTAGCAGEPAGSSCYTDCRAGRIVCSQGCCA